MRLPLDDLTGVETHGLTLRVEEHDGQSSPHPVEIHASSKDQEWVLFEGQTNPGTAWRHPWLEVRYRPWIGGEADGSTLDGQTQIALFEALGDVLVPGSYVMLSCDGHPDSLRALTVDVPPPCTALGYLLWHAGARWYKVWYYPEGWREGHEKVQGNLPMGDEHAAKRTGQRLDEIREFLEKPMADEYEACAKRGRELIEEHGEA